MTAVELGGAEVGVATFLLRHCGLDPQSPDGMDSPQGDPESSSSLIYLFFRGVQASKLGTG